MAKRTKLDALNDVLKKYGFVANASGYITNLDHNDGPMYFRLQAIETGRMPFPWKDGLFAVWMAVTGSLGSMTGILGSDEYERISEQAGRVAGLIKEISRKPVAVLVDGRDEEAFHTCGRCGCWTNKDANEYGVCECFVSAAHGMRVTAAHQCKLKWGRTAC